jgi:ubiquinone/menaquinone biosynthesis C-methylase UbiE
MALDDKGEGSFMALTKSQIRDVYRRRSANYDLTANLYYLIGFREVKFRKQAVSALELEQGDTVIELGCGTGGREMLLSPEQAKAFHDQYR